MQGNIPTKYGQTVLRILGSRNCLSMALIELKNSSGYWMPGCSVLSFFRTSVQHVDLGPHADHKKTSWFTLISIEIILKKTGKDQIALDFPVTSHISFTFQRFSNESIWIDPHPALEASHGGSNMAITAHSTPTVPGCFTAARQRPIFRSVLWSWLTYSSY